LKFEYNVKTDVRGVRQAIYKINEKYVSATTFWVAAIAFLSVVALVAWHLVAEMTYWTINLISRWSGGVVPRMSFFEAGVISAIGFVIYCLMKIEVNETNERGGE